MKLSKYKESSDYFTGKASEISRQLGLAGIAIIWIFKRGEVDRSAIPDAMLFPLILFAVALALDLLHYLYGGIAWSIFHRYHQRRVTKEQGDPDILASRYMNWPTWLFFISKIVCVLWAYFLLFKFLWVLWGK